MKVLSLETSTPFLSLGWLEEGRGSEHSLRLDRAHAERGLPELEAFLGASASGNPELIVVGNGPGSYTGVRVGVSLALGLARGWNASVFGVSTLEATAAAHEGVIAVTFDARKGSVYSAAYRVHEGRILETLLAPEKRELEVFKSRVPPEATWLEDSAPSGLALARLGFERFERGERGVEISYL
jgi:tRNA threonylcarbamoyladenosine biosynthesis protein TsaB